MLRSGASILAILLFSGTAGAAPKQLSVSLKDGSDIQGDLVERVPNDHLTLKLATGEVRRIEWSDIQKIEDGSSEARTRPTPRPAPSTVSASNDVLVVLDSDKPGARLEAFLGTSTGVGLAWTSRGTVPVAVSSEHWASVCTAPCQRLVQPNLEYRVNGDSLVSSDKFVIDGAHSNVRIKATMGSNGTRIGAALLALGLGLPTLTASAVCLGFGIANKSNPSMNATGDVLLVTSSILFAVSLAAFIPAIYLRQISTSSVEVQPAESTVYDGVVGLRPPKRNFSRDAAASTLGRAAEAIGECHGADDPTGPGHVKVTFASTGEVVDAVVDPPFGGTAMGECIAKRFRRANVPSFDGEPMTVGKTFQIAP